ncbi:MAG: anti-sigma F factor [Lachnospiraceae bacterium]|nr:anti-sigma F factor [Lachnospiraceae bacterium]
METNQMSLEFDAKSENEAFARITVAAFISQLDPTLEELADIKTAVSEAVTNSIIHGYDNGPGRIKMECKLEDRDVFVTIEDKGKGIEDIEKAREPLFTTKPELERSGMGFVFMEIFMDGLEVLSNPGEGCIIRMRKHIGSMA